MRTLRSGVEDSRCVVKPSKNLPAVLCFHNFGLIATPQRFLLECQLRVMYASSSKTSRKLETCNFNYTLWLSTDV